MAEVKVRITAQNETQTGFQAVLSDAKKTAAEVKKTFSQTTSAPRAMQPQQAGGGGNPFSFEDFYDDAIKKAEQQIEANLAKRKAAREAAAQAEKAANGESGNSVMELVSRFALLATAATVVGKVISMAFERVSDAFKNAAEVSKQLGTAFEQAGSATSIGSSIAGFKQITSIADQFKKIREETYGKSRGESIANLIQGRPGQFMARAADTFLEPFGMGGGAFLQSQEESARSASRVMLAGSLARQATNAEDLLGAGGNPEAIRKLQSQQQNFNELEDLKNALRGQDNNYIEKQIQAVRRRQEAESALTEQIKQRAAFDAADQLSKGRQESGMTAEQQLAKEKAALASIRAEAQKSGGMSGEAILEREKTLQRIQALEKSITSEREKQAAANREIDQRFADAQASKERSSAQDKQNAMRSAQRNLNESRFDAMSPEDKQKTFEQSVGAFNYKLERGMMSPQQMTEEAARLMQMFDAANQAPAGFQGSNGASAFQRIGFASNEYFDTRKPNEMNGKADKAIKILEQINKAIEKGEPIVLNP